MPYDERQVVQVLGDKHGGWTRHVPQIGPTSSPETRSICMWHVLLMSIQFISQLHQQINWPVASNKILIYIYIYIYTPIRALDIRPSCALSMDFWTFFYIDDHVPLTTEAHEFYPRTLETWATPTDATTAKGCFTLGSGLRPGCHGGAGALPQIWDLNVDRNGTSIVVNNGCGRSKRSVPRLRRWLMVVDNDWSWLKNRLITYNYNC